MPGFTTHYILGMKAYNDLPMNQLKYLISKYRWLYQLGLQGPDMFFYNIPVLRHRDYRNVGSNSHYTCHPYVYGRIHYDPRNPSAHAHGLHALLENDLDALLLAKYKKKKPSQFNQAATICLNGLETQFISRFLADCINETYYPLTHKNNYQVTARMVHRST